MAASEEDRMCMALWRHIQLRHQWSADAWLHIPNEGKRDPKYGAKLKAMGLRRGVADYHCMLQRGGYSGLWLEVKTGKGRPSKEQIDFLTAARGHGAFGVVGYGFDECKLIIDSWLLSDIEPIAWLQSCDKWGERQRARQLRA